MPPLKPVIGLQVSFRGCKESLPKPSDERGPCLHLSLQKRHMKQQQQQQQARWIAAHSPGLLLPYTTGSSAPSALLRLLPRRPPQLLPHHKYKYLYIFKYIFRKYIFKYIQTYILYYTTPIVTLIYQLTPNKESKALSFFFLPGNINPNKHRKPCMHARICTRP